MVPANRARRNTLLIDSRSAEDKAISDRTADRRLGYQKIKGDCNRQCITTKKSRKAATLLRKTAKGLPKEQRRKSFGA